MSARDIAEDADASLRQIRSAVARMVAKKKRFEGKTAARRYCLRLKSSLIHGASTRHQGVEFVFSPRDDAVGRGDEAVSVDLVIAWRDLSYDRHGGTYWVGSGPPVFGWARLKAVLIDSGGSASVRVLPCRPRGNTG